jgi:hypothetical protein
MPAHYLSCAETAKLVRQSLKEAFPDVKFSVKSHTYSMGASIDVRWLDGPNEQQVESVVGRFEASYFDGSIDYKGAIYHMMDGKQIRFGADSVRCGRENSDSAVQRAIDRVFRRLSANFADARFNKPTVAQFNRGELYNVQLPHLHTNGGESVQTEVRRAMTKATDRLKVCPSPTAGKIFVTHDDGYSRSSGAGFSAVSQETL